MSDIYLAKNQVFHTNTKHIDVRFQFVQEIFGEGDIELKIHTKENTIDMLNNIVSRSKFTHCKKLLHILSVDWVLMELIWMNYDWHDPSGKGYAATTLAQPGWVNMMIHCVWLRFEKSSPWWRIMGERVCKILLIGFFNPLEIDQRSNRAARSSSGCRQAKVLSTADTQTCANKELQKLSLSTGLGAVYRCLWRLSIDILSLSTGSPTESWIYSVCW